MAVLKEDFFAVPDGEIYPKMFRAGETVTGQVAEAARRMGKVETAMRSVSGEPVDGRALVGKPENQPKRRGRPPKVKAMNNAPENK